MKHPDPRLRAYCDLVVGRADLGHGRPRSGSGLGGAGRGRARGGPDRARAGTGRGRRRGQAAAAPASRWRVALGSDVTLLEATGTKAGSCERAVAAVEARDGRPRAVRGVARGEGRDASSWRLRARLRRRRSRPSCAAARAHRRAAILWTAAVVDTAAIAEPQRLVGGEVEAVHGGAGRRRLVVLRKLGATPERFPRRPGWPRSVRWPEKRRSGRQIVRPKCHACANCVPVSPGPFQAILRAATIVAA